MGLSDVTSKCLTRKERYEQFDVEQTGSLASTIPPTPTLAARLTIEFVGTYFLVFTIAMGTGQEHELACLATGFMLAALTYMGSHVSGAHYNPAVSLAVALRGTLPFGDMVPYMLTQLVGAVLGSATGLWVLGPAEVPCVHDEPTVLGWARTGTCEVLSTFALCLVVLSVTTTASQEKNSHFGLAVGATIFAADVSVGSITGGAFNPAVGLGLWLSKGLLAGQWKDCAYIAAVPMPMLGAMFAALVYRMALPSELETNARTATPPPTICAKLTAEFIGTFFLVFTIACTTLQQVTMAPLAIGLMLTAMVYMGGHISGGNYNPAVSLAVALRGALPFDDMSYYVLTQLVGATVASATASWVYSENTIPCLADVDNSGWAKASACEILFSCVLCLVVLSVTTTASQEKNSHFGLAIGATVFAGAVSVGSVSGGAFNPAVGLGLWLSEGLLAGQWKDCAYIVTAPMPMLGAMVAVLLHRVTVPSEH